MKVVITGIAGFVGSHLAEFLLTKKDVKVYGIDRWLSRLDNISHIKDKIELIECDLTDPFSTHSAIERIRPDLIFHLAAQSFVPTSWSAPHDTLTTNIIGQLNIFESVRKLGLKTKIQIACCYSADTKALTKEGFKYYNEIREGDLVLSLNPVTEDIEYKKVKKVIIQHYDGKMLHFKSKSCDLLVTPNHRLLVKKRKKGKLNFVKAEEINGRNYLPLGKNQNNKKVKDDYLPNLFYLIGIFIGDGYLVPAKKIVKWSGLSHCEYISKYRDKKGKFTELLKPQVKIYTSPRAFLAIPRSDKCREKIEKTLKTLNIRYHGYKDVIYFTPKGKILNILKQCNKGVYNKTIPQWLLTKPKDILQELFNGLIDSDGNWRKNRQQFYTVSSALVPRFIELCRMIGKWVTFKEIGSRKIKFNAEDREIMSKRIFYFSITDGEKIITDGSRKTINKREVDYNGKIWCVEVEDNHNLLVERNGKISFCGNSSEEYGMVYKNEVPIKETNPLRPLSPYAVSKVGQDLLGYQYHQSYNMFIVRTRGFNHTGPRRGENFVSSNFAKQIALIEKGKQKPTIEVGNLNAIRDFTDVRDMILGYWLALEKGKAGEVYNISTGKGVTIKEMLRILLSFTERKIKVKKDPVRLRPSDVQILIGDSSRFKKQTGWKPQIPIEKTLGDLLNYWRERV